MTIIIICAVAVVLVKLVEGVIELYNDLDGR